MEKDLSLESVTAEGRNKGSCIVSGKLETHKKNGPREIWNETIRVLSSTLSPSLCSPLSLKDTNYGISDIPMVDSQCSQGHTMKHEPSDTPERVQQDTGNLINREFMGTRRRSRRRLKQEISEMVIPSQQTFAYKPQVYSSHDREKSEPTLSDIISGIHMGLFFIMGIAAFVCSAFLLIIWSTAAYCFLVGKDFTESAVGAYGFRHSHYWENVVRKLLIGVVHASVDMYSAFLGAFQGLFAALGTLVSGAYVGFLESILGLTLNNADSNKQQTEGLLKVHQLNQQQYMVIMLVAVAAAICFLKAALVSLYRRQLAHTLGPYLSGMCVCMHQRLCHIMGLEAAAGTSETTWDTPATAETTPPSNPVESTSPVDQTLLVNTDCDDVVPIADDAEGDKGGNSVTSAPLEALSSVTVEQPVSVARYILDWSLKLVVMHARQLLLGVSYCYEDRHKNDRDVKVRPLEHRDATGATGVFAAATSVDVHNKLLEGLDDPPQETTSPQVPVHRGDVEASAARPQSPSHHKIVDEDSDEVVSESEWYFVKSTVTEAPSQ